MPGFLDLIESKCRVFRFVGPADLALATKLRWLKGRIRIWLAREKSMIEREAEFRNEEIRRLESVAERRNLSDLEAEYKLECKNVVEGFNMVKLRDLQQKSRAKWAVEGDENSSFFHGVLNSNISGNRMHGLLLNGEWVTDPLLLKEDVFEFFAGKFADPVMHRPKLICPNLARIREGDMEGLTRPFSLEEIKNAVWDCEGDRAPTPDGGVKVLVGRLKLVIGGLISVEQSEFLANRSILDGPLVLNEVIAWLNKSGMKGMLFKVDIDKAYDSVNWGYLDSIMIQMGFPNRWRRWVNAIIVSAHASVLVNGSPTREFQCTRGIRQGDPLSPLLFLIAMEGLSGMLKEAVSKGFFHGIRVGHNGPTLSHFLYADDAVLLGEWNTTNAVNLKRILRVFHAVSGLKVNLNKCRVFGTKVDDGEVLGIARILHCRVGIFPFCHLGLSVGGNMNLIKSWDPILELFKKRLSR
ncbi:uncharacterized protein LOC143604598 [Bidens hawaiensis]|uniref:uncharacterized protein LOC143604598 n=1 Tax=Bidens hawaiensis TaxID=980011 RepID=UPI00404B6BE0